MSLRYGHLFELDSFGEVGSARRLDRVPLNGAKNDGGYDEAWLQRLIALHPQTLPIGQIEPVLEGARPVCLEMKTDAGFVDVVLVTPLGDIVLVECKLWRNPQARREVVGQIIDYAKELPRLSYADFEAAIRKAQPAGAASPEDSLYRRAGGEGADLDEAGFVDAVSRNLRRGRFLLLIVGDGIQEGVEAIADFLQQHAGMHFTLALVEMAIFKRHPDGFLVEPRVIAKTTMVPRGIVLIEDGQIKVRQVPGDAQPATPQSAPATISEARLYEFLDEYKPGLADQLRNFMAQLEELGGTPRFTPTMIVLRGAAGARTVYLGHIDVRYGAVWFGDVANQGESLGRRDATLAYYRAVAALLQDPDLRAKKLNPSGVSGVASLPLDQLLLRQSEWRAAMRAYLDVLKDIGTDSV